MPTSVGLSYGTKIEKSEVLNISTVPQIPVFTPTASEFNDFMGCISKIEELGAHHIGLCKIIPPPDWKARATGYCDIGEYIVQKPVCQITQGSHGIFWQDIKTTRNLTFQEFSVLANSPRYCAPQYRDFDHLEKKYWSSVVTGKPLYGANVSGSLMQTPNSWDLSRLDSILSRVFESENIIIPGVNTPYLYYGMWRSTFPWHVEDVELYSVNYLHFGAPKHWYVIPPAYARKFEAFVFEYFRSDFLNCHCFLRHKCVLISPSVLARAGIPTRKITQQSGEFMITFPYGYHAGFNMGLNIAEAVNFALPRWIDFGKKALICTCWDDTVRICMNPFVKLYQPDIYLDWLRGEDTSPHPLMEYASSITEIEPQKLSKSKSEGTRKSDHTVPMAFRAKAGFQLGDLNFIDLRYSSSRLATSKLPWHITQYPKLLPLWCGQPIDLTVERLFNKLIGSFAPHCAVCSVLWSPQQLGKVLSSFPSSSCHRSKSSVPYISEVAYDPLDGPQSLHPPLIAERESTILTCTNCELCVHARCYGISESSTHCYGSESWCVSDSKDTWHCDACLATVKPSCILCYMRGGAMKPLANPPNEFKMRPYWAHIVCALANPGCRFLNVSSRLAAVSAKAIQNAKTTASRLNKSLHIDIRQTDNSTSSSLNFPSKKNSDLYSSRKRFSSVSPRVARRSCDFLRSCTVSGTLEDSSCCSSTIGMPSCGCDHSDIPPGVGEACDSACDSLETSRSKEHRIAQSDRLPVCSVCTLPTRGFLPLARCWFARCSARYHVTCAQMGGVLISSDSYPYLFYIACDSHPATGLHPGADTTVIRPGDEVMVRQTSDPPAFVPAVVVRRVSPVYCRVAFADGTFSKDTPPEYLINVDWSKDGPPPKGTQVKVLWKDNIEYTGTFQGTTAEKWEVRSLDGEVFKLSRDQFYVRQAERSDESKGQKRTLRETDDLVAEKNHINLTHSLSVDQLSKRKNFEIPIDLR